MPRARNGEIELEYERLGSDGEPLLLVMGVGQMIQWPDGFCDALTARGFAVARFDNRDAGGSTHLHDLGTPSALSLTLRPAAAAPYRLEDMADDAVAVLDALGWERAHLVGTSHGGMVAADVAVRYPQRVRTLTTISSTPSSRIGRPSASTLLAVLKVARRRVTTRDDYVRHLVDLSRVTASAAYPPDEQALRLLGARCFDRGHDQAGVQRRTAAFQSAGDRRPGLASVTAPTLVLHGEDDRLVRVDGGRATARAIPGARLVTYPGMGSELPPALWPAAADEIAALARERADR